MNKRTLSLLSGSLLLVVFLAACGDVAPSTTTSMAAIATPTIPPSAGPILIKSNLTNNLGLNKLTITDAMTENLKGLSGRDFEIAFLQNLIALHQQALQMAELIPTHTQRPELIALGQEIISKQTKEMADEKSWLSSWYNEMPLADPASVPGMEDIMSYMSSLQLAKDADFDRLFMAMMSPNLERAINMANLLPSRVQQSELLELAHNIVTDQSWEINEMDGWTKIWFAF